MPKRSSPPNPIKIMHLASGDRWAGAEVQLFTLLTQLNQLPHIEPIATLLNEGELAQRLRDKGIPVEVLDEAQLASGKIVAALRQRLRMTAPQILHTHRQKENILGAIANTLSIRARSVRTVHGANENMPKSLSQRLIRTLDVWTGNYLQQRVIAVSDDLANKLHPEFSTTKISVIENGVDIDAVQAAVKPVDFRVTAPHKIHIGIIGRLDPVKRIDIFLEMAQQLLREQPQTAWHFHVFGEGALENSLKALAATLQIETATTFHGHRLDIAACLAGLDAAVMCSDHEGLPMTVLEALAVGTPMLAHAAGGLNAVLAGGAGGLLVNAHSPQGYATALQQLLQQDRAKIHTKGLQRLHACYSAEANAARVAALYRGLLSSSPCDPDATVQNYQL